MADPKSSSAFLSYSHDSDDHAGHVLELADALRGHGINVILDQYVHPAPEEGWPHWMDRNLDEAQFVLMVCSATYRRRVMGEEEPGKGLGVRWEGSLIYNRIYHDKPSGSRFIPILLLPGSEPAHIPNPVQGHSYYRIATFDLADPGYEGLYRHLTGQAPTPPPDLGTITVLSPRPRPRPSPGPLPSSGGPPANGVGSALGTGNTVNARDINVSISRGAMSPAASGLDDQIRAVLRPLMATEHSRQARLSRAFTAYAGLLDRIATHGETGVFLSHLLQTLRDYGEVEPGLPAVAMLLESIKGEVGAGDRRRINQILSAVRGSDPELLTRQGVDAAGLVLIPPPVAAMPGAEKPAAKGPGERLGVPARLALVRELSGLAPADWATLVTMIPEAGSHVSRHGTVAEQVAELVRWAESPTGPGPLTIEEAAKELRPRP